MKKICLALLGIVCLWGMVFSQDYRYVRTIFPVSVRTAGSFFGLCGL